MGNSHQNSSHSQHSSHKRQSKIFIQTTRNSSHSKKASEEHTSGNQQSQIRRNQSLNNSMDRNHSSSKHKKFLSLSKTIIEHHLFADSKCRKGILITANQHCSTKNSVERFIKFNNVQTQPNTKESINKVPIKPRDLPRYSSHKSIAPPGSSNHHQFPSKILTTQTSASNHHNRNVSHLNQPSITIKYLVSPQSNVKLANSIKSSHVIPYAPNHNASNSTLSCHPNQLNDGNTKKLKKVGMSRSYVQHGQTQSVYANEGQKEQTRRKDMRVDNQEQVTKVKQCSNSAINKLQNLQQKENKAILAAPTLIHYTSENQYNRHFKESESKYALAYEQNGSIIEKSINFQLSNCTSQLKQKYSLVRQHQSQLETLQGKVDREVQSKPLIEQKETQSKVLIEQPFRFQTATDISYEVRSDNTSFIPIPSSFRKQLDGRNYPCEPDQILQYCKPKINEKVLADLLKLPLRH